MIEQERGHLVQFLIESYNFYKNFVKPFYKIYKCSIINNISVLLFKE